MAFTSAQLAALETAAASGQLRVRFGDREITYQSLADLLSAIEVARRDLATSATSSGTTRRYPCYGRGY